MAQEDVHHLDDAGLALGLSLGSGGGASDAALHGTSSSRLSREARLLSSPRLLEPSLTLSMPDEATATATATASGAGGGAAHSVSSLSVAGVKREHVDDVEGERASSTAAVAARAGAEDDDDAVSRPRVLPLSFSTASALRALCEWGVYADLIEVDAGHDFHSAWADINLAWAVLRPGGVMFGHDYFTSADDRGVRRAVTLFARVKGLAVWPHGQHWVLSPKPPRGRRGDDARRR